MFTSASVHLLLNPGLMACQNKIDNVTQSYLAPESADGLFFLGSIEGLSVKISISLGRLTSDVKPRFECCHVCLQSLIKKFFVSLHPLHKASLTKICLVIII